MITREPTYTSLKYGELIQVLTAARNNPGIAVQRVRVGHSEIRGDIVCTDRVSDGKDTSRTTPPIPFVTSRRGVENDQALHALLKQTVGSSYQGEEEESALKGV